MGNLPTSRTITLVHGDAVPSSLLNEIQDQHVGAKHPARPLFFPPIAFQAVVGAANVTFTGSNAAGGGVWTQNPASGAWEVETSLVVQPGTSIDSVTAYFKRHSSLNVGDTYVIRLLSRTLTAGAAPASQVDVGTTVLGNDPNTYPNLDVMSLAAVPIIALANTVYVLHWKTFAAGTPSAIFYGMGVSLSRL